MKQHIPNLLSTVRVALSLAVFFALVAVSLNTDGHVSGLFLSAFAAFVLAAVTDFFDGWLARLWKVESTFGAIIDPIADKMLVAAAIVGLAVAGDIPVGLFGGIMLFREFAVSAMREVLAPKGLRLPVTFLAKTKTTLQLVALGLAMFGWTSYGRLGNPHILTYVTWIMLAAATLVTIWTGVGYAVAARKALRGTN